MKKSLHQLLSKNPHLRVLAFHCKEAPFTLKKRNQEKLLAYKGVGMPLPPLGISQSPKNSLISLKDENLAHCSALCSLKFTLFRLSSFNFVQIRLKRGFLISTSRLARVSEFELSANLALSLENNRRLV